MWVEMGVAVAIGLLSTLCLLFGLDVHTPDMLGEEIFPWVLVLYADVVFGAEFAEVVA